MDISSQWRCCDCPHGPWPDMTSPSTCGWDIIMAYPWNWGRWLQGSISVIQLEVSSTNQSELYISHVQCAEVIAVLDAAPIGPHG